MLHDIVYFQTWKKGNSPWKVSWWIILGREDSKIWKRVIINLFFYASDLNRPPALFLIWQPYQITDRKFFFIKGNKLHTDAVDGLSLIQIEFYFANSLNIRGSWKGDRSYKIPDDICWAARKIAPLCFFSSWNNF